MDIIIQSLGFTSGEELDSFIHDKVGRLKGDKIIRANVTLFKGAASNPDANYCEIRLEVPGNDHFVKKMGPHFEVAVNECVEVLSHMISKAKDRVTDRQADDVLIQDIAADDTDESDVELEDVVK
jgi:ribosome-associated translation inhibitor RaiA